MKIIFEKKGMCVLSKIKFDDIMNFYPKHNHAIFDKIVATQKHSSLVPFVGAGMSVFCGYKLWGAVLSELAEFILIEDERHAVLNHINMGAYEKAAQMILDAYPAMLDQLPDLISPDLISNCPQEKFRTSAIFTLPYLFQKGLVITTNFDRVIETVYLNHNGNPIQAVTPNQQDRLAQLRQNQSLGLFKLHGDIGCETVSIEDLVFTEEQYKEKYSYENPLVQELTRWFENRSLLFLGCSLNVDRTMEVLKSVTLNQRGIRHYAIVGCKKVDIPKRLKEMNDLGILPIFYDDRDHEAVRVILERLLEETDQKAYKKLWTASKEFTVDTKEGARLLFDSDYFPFTGREQELKSLETFCDSDDNISWWAVTGPGGMGKSRLVYEFTNQKCNDGWKVARFEARPAKDSHANDIEALDTWIPETSRTIVVLDDVQAHMNLVRRWLNKMVRHPRSEKLRILMLEREGRDLNSSSWLGTASCDDVPVEWCYEENFLCLEPMTNNDLINIMVDYATAAGKKLNAELLLKTLERVDPELKRPIYAVAIADASCQGKDPTNWDRKKVLDTLLDRELDFHFNRLQGMTGKGATKTLSSELKELLARSCIRGFLFLDDVKVECYPKLAKKIDDLDMDFLEFMERLGTLRTIMIHTIKLDQSGNPTGDLSEEQRKIIELSCPDLIKEHLVLNLVLEDGKKDFLFSYEWEQDLRLLFFLGKLLMDYSDRLRNESDYWNTFFQATPQDVLHSRVYGRILWGYASNYPDDSKTAIDRLSRLYTEMDQAPEIAVEYAKGLVNLTVNQDLERKIETIAQLNVLYQNHPDIPELVAQLAKGLVNLTFDQDLEEKTETIAQLNVLYQNHPDIPELVAQLAKGLVNLTFDLDLERTTETVAQLEELYQNHPDIPELAAQLAKGLVNLTFDLDLERTTETVTQLEELYQNHPDISELAFALATGLARLTYYQDLESTTETVAQLDKLYQNFSNVPKLVIPLAIGLANLTYDQNLEEEMKTVARLNELYQNHPDIPELVVQLAKGLTNLTYDQDLERKTKTVAQLEELHQNHSDIPELVLSLAKGLAKLTYDQNLEGITETIARLDKLYQNYSNIPKLVIPLAIGLANLTYDQNLEEKTKTVARLDELYQNHPDIPELAISLAKGLSNNLTCNQDLEGTTETVAQLEELYQNHPDIPELAFPLATGLAKLTYYQDLEGTTETVAQLDKLYQNYSNVPKLVIPLAIGLANLTYDQNLEEEMKTVARLNELYQNHPDIPELVVQLAKGLANLTYDQDLERKTKTVARLEELHQNHPDIPELIVQLAKGLSTLTYDQNLEVETETVARLEELYQNHPDIPELANLLAKGLANLTDDQDPEKRTEIVTHLEELYQNHPDVPKLAISLARGLVNLTYNQNLEERTKTVTRIDKLHQNHPDMEIVAVLFTRCLVNLSFYQKSEYDVRETLSLSTAYSRRYPENSGIQLNHAKTWFNLTLQQHDADIPATVNDIANFLRSNDRIIPQFKEALDDYLHEHPNHAVRYQLLLQL